jgi:hypothetical protein
MFQGLRGARRGRQAQHHRGHGGAEVLPAIGEEAAPGMRQAQAARAAGAPSAFVIDRRPGHVERVPSELPGAQREIRVFQVHHEPGIEAVELVEHGAPHEQAGAGHVVDSASLAVIPVGHAKPAARRRREQAESGHLIEDARHRQEPAAGGLRAALFVDERQAENRRARMRRALERLDGAGERLCFHARIGIQEEQVLGFASRRALTARRREAAVRRVVDRDDLGQARVRAGTERLVGRIVHDHDAAPGESAAVRAIERREATLDAGPVVPGDHDHIETRREPEREHVGRRKQLASVDRRSAGGQAPASASTSMATSDTITARLCLRNPSW